MTYITAQAVTNEQGYTIANGGAYFGAKTVDVLGKRRGIWNGDVDYWQKFTINNMLFLTQQSRAYLNARDVGWLLRYERLTFYLSNLYPPEKTCMVGYSDYNIKAIRVDRKEYRMRGHQVYDKLYNDDRYDRRYNDMVY
jgi:hypothetical protein